MVFEGHSYRVLVVSSSDKFNATLRQILQDYHIEHIAYASSVAAAKRSVLEKTYDFVIVNSPLLDDSGLKFAMDQCANKNTVCLVLVKAEVHDEVHMRVVSSGLFTLPKPTSSAMVAQAVRWMSATRERLRKLERKTLVIEDKMEEIRLVNRAKWLLIDNLQMTEPDAHRYIEKQAMDRCVTKREIAQSIIGTYR